MAVLLTILYLPKGFKTKHFYLNQGYHLQEGVAIIWLGDDSRLDYGVCAHIRFSQERWSQQENSVEEGGEYRIA